MSMASESDEAQRASTPSDVRTPSPAPLDELDPTNFSLPDAELSQHFVHDVDSIVACATTLEPFQCRVAASFDTRPQDIMVCKNKKLTDYLNKRDYFGALAPAAFRTVVDRVDPIRRWYEFELGTIDDRSLFVLFQTTGNPREEERRARRQQRDTPLRRSCQSFVRTIVLSAVADMTRDCTTARHGAKYVRYDVDKSYRVFAADFIQFARRITRRLRICDLSRECDINVVRFYCWKHGLRLNKFLAKQYVDNSFRLSHPHMDVVQLHVGDTMVPSENPILVRLTDHVDGSLSDLYRDGVQVGTSRRLQRYKIGFLADYGHFAASVAPVFNENITFAQAYNSAAKFARPTSAGDIAAFLISRGFRRIEAMAHARNSMRQQLYNVLSFAVHYVQHSYQLRIEEVVTIDARRHDIRRMVAVLRVFDDTVCSTTRRLMETNLFFKFSNWQRYFKNTIGDDFEVLNNIRRHSFTREIYVPHEDVIRAMRAEFRLNYFVHGSNVSYSYSLLRDTFVYATEARSIENGLMLLHPARLPGDERDHHYYLYSAVVPAPFMTAVRHLYAVARFLRTDDSLEYMVVAFASWAYRAFFANDQDSIEFAVREYRRSRAPFSMDVFLRVVNEWRARHPSTRIDIVNHVQAEHLLQNLFITPATHIANVIKSALRVDEDETMRRLDEMIRGSFDVVPANMWTTQYLKSKTSFSVVKVGLFRRLPDGGILDVGRLRRDLDRRFRQPARPRVLSSGDDDDGYEDTSSWADRRTQPSTSAAAPVPPPSPRQSGEESTDDTRSLADRLRRVKARKTARRTKRRPTYNISSDTSDDESQAGQPRRSARLQDKR